VPALRHASLRSFQPQWSSPADLGVIGLCASLQLPRVVCTCGGSVALDFKGLLRPYQRLGDEIDAQIHRWGAISISLREMQAELAHSAVGRLGLRTINERLHQLGELTPDLDATQVPPILQIDAIWFTQLYLIHSLYSYK